MSSSGSNELPLIGETLLPLKKNFNENKNQLRFVALLSPT